MNAARRIIATRELKLSLVIFVISFFIFRATSAGDTAYNYFTRLADAFIHGRLYLTEAPSWLSELVPITDSKFYVVQPPMPALLAIPFVLLFGVNFPQQIIAHLIGAAIAVVSFLLALSITKKYTVGLWAALLGSLGTVMWFEAAVGSVWYLGQLVCMLFLLLAIYMTHNTKKVFLVGLFVGAAYLSRVHTILSLPFFLFALKDELFVSSLSMKLDSFWKPSTILSLIKTIPQILTKEIKWKRMTLFLAGLGVFLGLNALYNIARWGVPWDKGYFLIPGILNEPWFSKGMLNVAYLPDHLSLLFLKLPIFLSESPYIRPSWYGLAIWLTTPVFIFVFAAPWRNNLTKLAWVAIGFIFLILGLRGGTGWTQFGYRYAVDFHAFLFYLLFLSIKKTGLTKFHWILLAIGIIVNLWGVLWINKFGWVSF